MTSSTCPRSSRAGRGPGRRGRGRPGPRPPASSCGEGRPRRRRCRRRRRPPASPSPGAARRGRRAAGRPARTPVASAAAGHLPLQPADHAVGLAGHEVAEVVDDLAVLVGVDPADARRRALADVAEQARPADLPGPAEDAGASRSGPGRPAAAGRASPGSPRRARTGRSSGRPSSSRPRITCSRGYSSSRVTARLGIGLVVPVADVEPRVELLDPVVLQLQRLDLGGHDGPLDAAPRWSPSAGSAGAGEATSAK